MTFAFDFNTPLRRRCLKVAVLMLCALFIAPPELPAAVLLSRADEAQQPGQTRAPESPQMQQAVGEAEELENQEILQEEISMQDEAAALRQADREAISLDENIDDGPQTVVVADDSPYGLDGKKIFNPDPTRAVWLSALFPGLGQVYNRRYWKLPIVIGGFMGLAYATNWNNNQYSDYSQAYRDIADSDPTTNSYMNFFPPTTQESDLDMAWLTSVMQSRKNYYRRNRDLCIICIAALYMLCLVDAYVDASMAHFDISPDLSLDMTPAIMLSPHDRRYSLGLNWAFTF